MRQKMQEKKFYFRILDQLQFQSDNKTQEVCVICLSSLFVESVDEQTICAIKLACSHVFHWQCIKSVIINNSCLKCPVCNSICGTLIGDQPEGTMNVSVVKQRCDGFNCDTILIRYHFNDGTRNGKKYSGTTRDAVLPNNPEGQQALTLLYKAFRQKLTFTIGTSVTTGLPNSIIWNGIHHKTSFNGGPTNFGYPDPTYFDRLKKELKLKGLE